MVRVRHRWPAADPGVAALTTPRQDLLVEQAEEDGSFTQSAGPFRAYRRTLVAEGGPAGTSFVIETTDYHLPIPWWRWLLAYPVRRAVRRVPPRVRAPWWAPPDVVDERQVAVLGLLAAACLAVGYLNTLFTQTVAFAADDFGASEEAQGVAGTVVRFGIIFAIGFLVLADRVGRRRMLVAAAATSPILCSLGALAPSFAWLTVSQALGRPIAIAMGLLVGIVAAEEMPRNSRAYAISLLALATGLGAGFAVMALPLADVSAGGWRLVYVLALAFLTVAVSLWRHLPETRRFEVPHAESPRISRRRFALLAASVFLLNVLAAPASFFQNRYLKDVRGYSASLIAIFTLVTNTPGGIGVVVGGRLADAHGRRIVGAIAVLGGTIGTAVSFYVVGAPLWLANTLGTVVGAASVPALGVYAAELFPTGRRGMANGLLAAMSLFGASLGLLVAGNLLDQGVGYGPVMTLLSIGPMIVVVLVAVWFPETAHLTLEEINPEDQPVPGSADPTQERRDR